MTQEHKGWKRKIQEWNWPDNSAKEALIEFVERLVSQEIHQAEQRVAREIIELAGGEPYIYVQEIKDKYSL